MPNGSLWREGLSTVDFSLAQPRIYAGQHGHRSDLLDPLEACIVVAQTCFKNAGWNVLETPATGPVVEVRQHVPSDDDRAGCCIDQDTLKTDGVTGQGQRADPGHDLRIAVDGHCLLNHARPRRIGAQWRI